MRDGVRVETRLNEHREDGWAAAAYIWTAAGDDAERQIEAQPDVSGTAHDVPSAQECLACHGGRGNFTLGFSATQLDVETRARLFEDGVLSHEVEGDLDLPEDVRAGLGVLHGNCSHCHNATRHAQPLATTCFAPDPDDTFDLSLPHDLDDVEDAPAVLTARFFLGAPGQSGIVRRMSERNLNEEDPSMPPLGTERVDDEGVAKVEALIAALPEEPRRQR